MTLPSVSGSNQNNEVGLTSKLTNQNGVDSYPIGTTLSRQSTRVDQILTQIVPIDTLTSSRSLSPISLSNSSSTTVSPVLDWRQRPEPLQKRIDKAFLAVNQSTSSRWGLYNGDFEYHMCSVEEQKLMKKMILDAYPKQKEFYVVDFGAGNFQWGRALADYLDSQPDLPKDIKVHIIGVRGEQNLEKPITDTPRCRIYELGSFKIEEMTEQFKRLGLDLHNKIDMASSRWCLRHLADPVGTFVQIVNCLRPKTGHFMFDGFLFLYQDQLQTKDSYNENMVQLLSDANVSFLMKQFDSARSLNHFVIQKKDDMPCQLPMSYAGVLDAYRYQIGSENMTRFNRAGAVSPIECWGDMTGDKNLHEKLKQNHLLTNPNICWTAFKEMSLSSVL